MVDRDERIFEVVIDGSSTAFRADSDDDKHRWLSAVRAALSRHDAVRRPRTVKKASSDACATSTQRSRGTSRTRRRAARE